jgi:hypothetical protein
MVKNILHKILTLFIGQPAKGQPADYPTLGNTKIRSTCMPDDKLDFNSWTSNFEHIKTIK